MSSETNEDGLAHGYRKCSKCALIATEADWGACKECGPAAS